MSLSSSSVRSFPLISLLLPFLSLCSLFSSVFAQASINSPFSVTECLPQLLTVSGGTPPYIVQVLPGGATGGTPLETLPTIPAEGSVTWVVDIESGQNITLAVRDATGAVNYSSQIPVLSGSSTDCIGQNAQNGTASLLDPTATAIAVPAANGIRTIADSAVTSTGTDEPVELPTFIATYVQ